MSAVTADDPGGRTIRLLLLPIFVLPLTLGWLRLAGERYGHYETALGTAMMILIFIVILSTLSYHAGRRVSQWAASQRESEGRLTLAMKR
jgi:Kef-type K+ transport system membrane component KefB